MPETKILPPVELLWELLDCDAESGRLTFKSRDRRHFKSDRSCLVWNVRFAGKPALHGISSAGYRYGRLLDGGHSAHRVIWKMHYGVEPDHIDHINGNRTDNRIVNLRSVTAPENMRNKARYQNNKSGATGVHWCNTRSRWVASIYRNGKQKQIGIFRDEASAIDCRVAAEEQHGYHQNHGRETVPA